MLEWMTQIGTARTVSMANAAFEPGSPGKVFGLSERALNEAVAHVADTYEFGQLATTAGAMQFAVTAGEPLSAIARSLLGGYYRGMCLRLSRPLGDAPATDYVDAFAGTARCGK